MLVTALLILAAVLVAALLGVLSSIAAIAEILPTRPGQVEESRGTTVPAQNRMPTRIGMKSQ
jgi:hypothetical protein